MGANYCWNCGGKLEEGMRFCPQCGTSIQPETEKQSMPESGALKPLTRDQSGLISEIIDAVRKWTQIEFLGTAVAEENTDAFKDSSGSRDYSPAYEPSGAAQQFHKLMASSYFDLAGSADSTSPRNDLMRGNVPLRDQAQVAGTWFYQLQTPYGIVNYQLFMDSTKNFACQSTLNGLMLYDMGEYQHQGDFLHFVVKNHEPKVRNGKKEHWLTSWGYYYTVVDANKLIFEDRLVGGRFYVYRVKGK